MTVGGIVSEAKKVRTRSGGYVMFATLDDLEGQVELFVRDAAGEAAEALEVDRVVVVRGRVDHKGRGETNLVVHEVEPFEPGADEIAAARAKLERGRRAAGAADRRGRVRRRADRRPEGRCSSDFPGETEVLLEMRTREGMRRLRFGAGYRVAPSPALRAELDELLGPAALAA